jgi:LPXTG-site transpeptidase (sortase) family protein
MSWAIRLLRLPRTATIDTTEEFRSEVLKVSKPLANSAGIKVVRKPANLLVLAGILLSILGAAWIASDVRAFEAEDPTMLAIKDQGFRPYVELIPEEELLDEKADEYSNVLYTGTTVGGNLTPQAANSLIAWAFPATRVPIAVAEKHEIVPERLIMPDLEIEAPVVAMTYEEFTIGDDTYRQWLAPDEFAAGWHEASATLGEPGNTVLNGHHNVYGEIFRDLDKLEEGALIYLAAGDQVRTYVVTAKVIFEEQNQPLEIRTNNAKWIQPTADERITLVTCWPYESNSHRLIIVAQPESQPTTPDSVNTWALPLG